MATISIKTNSRDTARKLEAIRAGLTPRVQSRMTRRVGARALAEVVRKTPKRWTGMTRRSWNMQTHSNGATWVVNKNKVAHFLEEGTKAHGPKKAKFLYIPRNRKASFGWNKSLKRGKDYILTKRVKGIKARHTARKVGRMADRWLQAEAEAYIRTLV